MYKTRTRVLSVICIVLTLISFITSCYSPAKVYADSNDNRALDLAIAEGKTRAEISEIATNNNGGQIDNNSMRTIALYLSNFYQPFVTTLTDGSDIGVSTKTAEDEEAEKDNANLSQFSTDAINALTKYCGVDEEVAQILVKSTLKQSLETCQHLYVKRSLVEKVLKQDADYDTGNNIKNTLMGKVGFSGFSRSWNEYKKNWFFDKADMLKALSGNYQTTIAWKLVADNGEYKKAYKLKDGKTVKDYIDKLYEDGGNVTVDSTDYVELTYFLYLTLLSYSANHAVPADGDTTSKAIYNIYWYDKDTTSMVKCFDTGGSCTQAFLLSTNEIDTEHGVGTAMSSLPLEIYEQAVNNTDALDGMSAEVVRKALAFFQPMYVNWVGDIVINDGTNCFVVVPGCLNPYSFVKISDNATDYLNGISVKALTYKANGLLSNASENTSLGLDSSSLTLVEESAASYVDADMAKNVATSLYAKLVDLAEKSGANQASADKELMIAGALKSFYYTRRGKDGGSKRNTNYPMIYCYESNSWLSSQNITDEDTADVYVKENSDMYNTVVQWKSTHGYAPGIMGENNSNHYLFFWTYKGLYNYLHDAGFSLTYEDWKNLSKETTKLTSTDDKIASYTKVIDELETPTIETRVNAVFSDKEFKGASDRYDIATHARLPECGTKPYIDFDNSEISTTVITKNDTYKNGDVAMFTKNGWVTYYGSQDDDPMDFDGEGPGKQAGDAMYEIMSDYGTVAYKYNTGKNYITFPALVFSTFTCANNDFAKLWSERIAAGFGPTKSDVYKDSFAYIRLYGTASKPNENLTGYKMHTDLIYFPDYSVDITNLSSAVQTANIFDTEDKIQASSVSDMSPYTSVTNGYGHTLPLSDTSKELYRNIFMTYAFAEANYEDDPSEFDETKHVVDLKCNFDAFPEGTGTMDFTYIEDTTGEEIESFIYYLLHPTKGISYVATWFKNKVAGILLYLHESIVGSSDSNYTTGMTKFLGTSSYTTMPKLTDIKLLNNVLSVYNNILIYIVMLLAIVLMCFIIVGEITIQRGIIGLICFTFLAVLPPYLLNSSANVSNILSDKIFSNKFEYWAISQMETYMDVINTSESDAVITDNALELATQVSLASASTSVGGESKTGYSGTMIKWMSPKKFASSLAAEALQQTAVENSTAVLVREMLNYTSSSEGSGQEFVHNVDNALYLYRDYVDIYRYGANSYNIDVYCGNFLNQSVSSKIKELVQNVSTQSTEEHGVYNVWHSKDNNDTDDIKFSKLAKLTYSSGMTISDFINRSYKFGLGDKIQASNYYTSDTATTEGMGKLDDKSDYANVLDEQTSIFAMQHGFLYNTFGDTLMADEGINYFSYNNTRASTLLLTYAATVAQTQDALDRLNTTIESGNVDITYKNFVQNETVCFGIPHNSFNADLSIFNNIDDDFANSDTGTADKAELDYKRLSDFYYDLYSESPYFYFNYNIRDQLINTTDVGYQFSKADRTSSKNNLTSMWLINDQDYFYNNSAYAADGKGRLRDFMNFHDFFYYVVPQFQPGLDLLYTWDNNFGYKLYDDCSLKLTNKGTIKYNGQETPADSETDGDNKLSTILSEDDWNELTVEEQHKLWHNYNVNLINLSYCSWLDTMEDCDYAKPETIHVLGERYTVKNPLDPTSYYDVALEDTTVNGVSYKAGDIIAGRYMVFSESEMAYYGLTEGDLTKVERKIIKIQKEVYKETLKLMNYKAVSDENLIHAFAMLETFIFNREFSQQNLVTGGGYILYPQGYELKAFTYDAYLRLVLAESSSNIDLEEEGTTNDKTGNQEVTSIYKRIMDDTSIFFGVLLIFNDLLAVYAIPALKLLILIVLFFLSIFLLVSSILRLDFNIFNNFVRSLLAPLLVFTGSCIGLSFVTSLFMSNGADYITESSTTMSLGDPTMTVIIMIVLNGLYVFINAKLLVKCFRAMVDYMKAVGFATLGAATGAFRTIGNSLLGNNGRLGRRVRGLGRSVDNLTDSLIGGSARSRGALNGAKALAGGALAGAATSAALSHANSSSSEQSDKAKLDFYNGVSDKDAAQASRDAKADSDRLNKQADDFISANRKKHRSEVNADKYSAAVAKAEQAKQDMKDKDLGVFSRAKAFGSYAKNSVNGNIALNKFKAQSRIENMSPVKYMDEKINGSNEFRGMTRDQVRQAKGMRSQATQFSDISSSLQSKSSAYNQQQVHNQQTKARIKRDKQMKELKKQEQDKQDFANMVSAQSVRSTLDTLKETRNTRNKRKQKY